MIKFLIIGFGKAGKRHFDIIQSINIKKSIAILESSRNKNLLKQYNNIVKIKDLTAIKKYRPDITIIASPSSFHISDSINLLKLNSSLLIEKPLSNSTENLDNLKKLVLDSKLYCLVGYNMMFLPSYIKFRKILKSNKYGYIKKVEIKHLTFMPAWRDMKYENVVSSNSSLGGGVLLELSHEIHYMVKLFKNLKYISGVIKKNDNFHADVESYCNLNFLSNSNIDQNSFKINIKMDFFSKKFVRYCKVHTNKGILIWDYNSRNIKFINSANKKETLYEQNESNDISYINQMSYFLKNYKIKKGKLNDFSNNYLVLKFIDKIKGNI